MDAVAAAYLEVAGAQRSFAVGGLGLGGVVGHFVDKLAAAGLLQKETGVDQAEEEELPQALRLTQAAFGLPELMYRVKEWITALQLRYPELYPRFLLNQEQMGPELWVPRLLGNCQACDQQEQGFAHRNLLKI